MVWLVFAGLVLALLGFNLPFFLFLLLAILAEIFPLKMGSGDFLYMALIALVFSYADLLLGHVESHLKELPLEKISTRP